MRISFAPMPISCSSKPGMKVLEPITTWMPSPVPPSKTSPLMLPLKLMVTRSPEAALAPSPLSAKVRLVSAMRLIASSTSVSVTSATGFDLEGLEVGERDRRHHFDRNRVGQIGLAAQQLLDILLLRRHGDLRLGREAEAAFGEQLRVGVANGLVDGFGHHRAAIDLLQVRDRHLARTEAVDADLVLEVDELGAGLGIEIRRGNADLELVLQTFREGFCDLHGVQSSSRSVPARRASGRCH